MRKGYTLIETNVGVLIFFIILVCCFAMFKAGSDAWVMGTKRHSLQNTVRRFAMLVEGDLRKSSFSSVSCSKGSDTAGEHLERDALCFAGVESWEAATFDQEFMVPRWSVYIVYFATGEVAFDETLGSRGSSGSGRIVRMVIKPKGNGSSPYDFDANGDHQADQYAAFDGLCAQLRSDPDSCAAIARSFSDDSWPPRVAVLGSVRRFRVDPRQGARTVSLAYEGREKVRGGSAERQKFESLQVELGIFPENSIQ